MPNENLLIIFAKPPVPGLAKTRLIPALGEQGAADFYSKLLQHTLDNVCCGFQWNVQLWLANHLMPEFFQIFEKKYRLSLHYQQGNDLGERMYFALEQGLSNYRKVALIGTDCPMIDSQLLEKTFALLDNADLVISPAEDGGYVQIAARKINRQVFADVQWGTATVLQQTQRNLETAQLTVSYTEMLWDVDEPQDLNRLRNTFYALANELPPA